MLKQLILTFLILVFSAHTKDINYLIIGAGPVGLFLANQLLDKNENCNVEIVESRDFIRRQCIRLPYEVANIFPNKVKENLWPVDSLRKMIFKNQFKSDPSLQWPKLGYHHFPRISVGNMQTVFKTYLEDTYNKRFKFTKKTIIIEDVNSKTSSDTTIIFITTGNVELSQKLREKMSISQIKYQKSAPKHGFYLIYRNIKDGIEINEDYVRDGNFMIRNNFSIDGLTYSASNNQDRDVQIYIYPDIPNDSLKKHYVEMPESFKKSGSFPKGINYNKGRILGELNLSELEVEAENKWLNEFRLKLDNLFTNHQIYIPNNANLHYAPRIEYSYEKTFGLNENSVPVVFVGDSMGGTDYKHGLNLGRGLYCANNLVNFINKSNENLEAALNNYQNYWNNILDKEFGTPNRDLISDDEIFYKYVIQGRTIDNIVYSLDKIYFYKYMLNQSKKSNVKN